MKTKIWTPPLLAAVAACSGSSANNAADVNNATPITSPANSTTAAPAQRAMPVGLDCIRNKLSPDEYRALGQYAAEEGPNARGDDPRAEPFSRAGEACKAELSWSQQKLSFAGMYTFSAAALAVLQEALTRQRIDLTEVNRAIELDEPLKAAADINQYGRSNWYTNASADFAARHPGIVERMAGSRSLDRNLDIQIGHYVAFHAFSLTMTNRFAREPHSPPPSQRSPTALTREFLNGRWCVNSPSQPNYILQEDGTMGQLSGPSIGRWRLAGNVLTTFDGIAGEMSFVVEIVDQERIRLSGEPLTFFRC